MDVRSMIIPEEWVQILDDQIRPIKKIKGRCGYNGRKYTCLADSVRIQREFSVSKEYQTLPKEHFSSYLTIHSHCCPLENANTKISCWETVFPTSKIRDRETISRSSFLKQLLEDEPTTWSKWSNLSLKVLFLQRSVMVTWHNRTSNMKS